MVGYQQFAGQWGERARLAWDTLAMRPTRGIPAWTVHVMDIPFLEEFTGHQPGDYARDPEGVYLDFQKAAGACFIDQWIPRNPLTMGQHGFEAGTARTATTGADRLVLDGIEIDSPEAVVEHLQRVVWPQRQRGIEVLQSDVPVRVEQLARQEVEVQRFFGPDLLKGPYSDGFQGFPALRYGLYGYADYFMAYALYPEVIEKDFAQQADLAVLKNLAAARAIVRGGLPRPAGARTASSCAT